MKLRTSGLWLTAALSVPIGCGEPPIRRVDNDAASATESETGDGNSPSDSLTGGTRTPDRDTDSPPGEDDGAAETGTAEPEGEGPTEFPLGRRVRRLTADQYARSLEVATGQAWPDYPEYAAALGKADYAEITSDDTSLSVTFDKFIHDGALYSCKAALDEDLASGRGVILGALDLETTDEDALRQNLQRLMVRFLAVSPSAQDPSLDPWLGLLSAEAVDGEATPELRRERWIAVCVGLATHVDFVTY